MNSSSAWEGQSTLLPVAVRSPQRSVGGIALHTDSPNKSSGKGGEMATRVVDEREHRRGLVLGLTLAEVLLLLLFLVMLAFSIPLTTRDKSSDPQQSASALRHEVERLKRLVDQLTGGKPPNEVLQKLKALGELEKELASSKLTIAELKERLAGLKPYLA